MMTLGKKIAQTRKELNLSQEQLAEKLSVSRSAVAKWESDNGMPDIDNLKVLSGVLNIPIDELLDNHLPNIDSTQQKYNSINLQNENTKKETGDEKNDETKNNAYNVDIQRNRDEDKNVSARTKYLEPYIGKCCTINLTDWNDGVVDADLMMKTTILQTGTFVKCSLRIRLISI